MPEPQIFPPPRFQVAWQIGAVIKGTVGEQQAKQELQRVIIAMVEAS